MKRVLVTGDRGYIGSVLIQQLLSKGYGVVGYDTDYFASAAVPNVKHPQYKKITKDIRNISEKDLENIDSIIHLSALSNDPMGDLDASLTEEINYLSSIKFAKLAKKIGVKRFLFSSSCSIYGIAAKGVVDETSPVNALTAYAKSKIDTENELRKLADNNFCVGLLRNSTVYGFSPKFRNDLVVNNLVTTALAYKQIRVMSDGTPWRPLIDVRDLSSIFIKFLNKDSQQINSEVINIGFEENNFQVKDLVNAVQKYIPECEVVYTGEHGKDTRSYKVHFNKFKHLFPNITQEWTLERSIADLVENLQKMNFTKTQFESGIFTRLSVLKKQQEEGKLDKKLFWINS